jgi:nitroimidazol reductase NimA-like FMN-containing flavoprotein (pyridoxamine 5'-phosphate oxidase superfamily)
MTDLTMSVEGREAFLCDLHVGVLAVERVGGPPFSCPIWYRYEPGGAVEFVTESTSVKVALLRAAGRATFCVQREQPPYAYVTVSGPVEVRASTRDECIATAARYLGEAAAPGFVDSVNDDTLVRIVPERWSSVDFAKLG